MKKETAKMLMDAAKHSSLGLSVALSIVIGLFLGFWLDKVFDTEPVLMFVFLMLGIAAGFRNIWHEIRKIKESDERNTK
ncbi:MAG: AtpZ/AtpI family protein [Desulfobacterales bacterium]|nr:AtpZ/AtpI family protein [Desulfobacterales bacterium]MCP4164044.1 AtpZ/AtpI family protein [Deltaproteobacteria bacterium]